MRPPADRGGAAPRHQQAATVAALLLATAGCSSGPPEPDTTPAAATRPAAKETCRDVRWQPPPTLRVEPSSRELIGFSPTLLGVETTWAGEGFTLRTVAGGYIDDLTEPFDDLAVTGHLALSDGVEAEVLRGTLQEDVPVLVVLWRDPAQDVPCDVHALLAVGVDGAGAAQVLEGLR